MGTREQGSHPRRRGGVSLMEASLPITPQLPGRPVFSLTVAMALLRNNRLRQGTCQIEVLKDHVLSSIEGQGHGILFSYYFLNCIYVRHSDIKGL